MGVVAVSLLAVALTSGPAFSARGGGVYSVTVKPVEGTAAPAASWPRYGDYVTFALNAPNVDQPYVLNECFQGGVRVSAEVHGFYSGYMFGTVYSLGPTALWTGGAADCTATLYTNGKNGKTQVLATSGYSVSG
jgi:hypothetical protein